MDKASDIVEYFLAAYITASDETIFGDAFFEPIAKIVSGGTVSPTPGVDFAVETDKRYLAVAMKSGPNIFNASQKKRQSDEFNELRSRLLKIHKQFDALLGHAYGKLHTDPTKNKIYRDRSGQEFWTEITGDKEFYIKLIELMKEEPLKYRKQYHKSWGAAINRFTMEFISDFCLTDGTIDWKKFTRFVSEARAEKSS